MATLVTQSRNADGSYVLIVQVANEAEPREYAFAALDDDAALHEGGPVMTEDDYLASQRAEVKALLDAETAPADTPESVVLAADESL